MGTIEPEDTAQVSRLRKRLEREKKARAEAESIAEAKTAELFSATTDLERLTEVLQEQLRLQMSPVLHLWDGILALPVIGTVDAERAAAILDRLLTRVAEEKPAHVILDLTGVEHVDTETANHIMQIVAALRLLGTQGVLTGIRPNVARAIVGLGIDLAVDIRATLRDGLKACIAKQEE